MIKRILEKKFNNKGYRSISMGLVSSLFKLIISFVIISIITKKFGLDIYGQVVLVISTFSVVTNIISVPTSDISIRFQSYFMENRDKESYRAVFMLDFLIQLILSALIFISTILFSKFYSETFLKTQNLSSLFIIYSIIISLGLLKGSINSYFITQKKFKIFFLINPLELAFRLLIILLVVNFSNEDNAQVIISTYMIASIISFLILVVIFLFDFKKNIGFGKLNFDRVEKREFFNYSLQLFSSTTIKGLYLKLPELFIAYFFDATSVAYFSIIRKVTETPSYFTGSLSSIAYPKLLKLKISKKHNEVIKFLNSYNMEIILINILYLCLILLFSNKVFDMFNVEVPNTTIIVLATIGNIIGNLLWWSKLFSSAYNTKISLKINIMILVFSLICYPVFLKSFTISGAFLSFILCFGLGYVYLFYLSINELNLKK